MIRLAREGTIIRHVGNFEMYLQAWALNYLLAMLERGEPWTPKHTNIACRLSPVHFPTNPPGVIKLIELSEAGTAALGAAPALLRDPETREHLSDAAAFGVSALDAAKFWIRLRNLVTHRGGWVSTGFLAQYETVWKRLFVTYRYRESLRAGAPLPMAHKMVASAGFCLARAARILDGVLTAASDENRGGLPPSEPPATVESDDEDAGTESLLRTGDHEASLRWVADPDFRESLLLAAASE